MNFTASTTVMRDKRKRSSRWLCQSDPIVATPRPQTKGGGLGGETTSPAPSGSERDPIDNFRKLQLWKRSSLEKYNFGNDRVWKNVT